MKIFESQSSFELSVVLTDAEALLYREVFRTQMPITIPELDNRKFIVKEMSPYHGEGAPKNSWHLVIKQEAAEHTLPPTASGELTYQTIRLPQLEPVLEHPHQPASQAFNPDQEIETQRLTIFGDIHANLPALQAVLADTEARDLSPLYCLGDLVGYCTFPNEVVATIQERNIPTLMGNYDQGIGNDSDDCGCAYTNPVAEALGRRSIAWSKQNTSADTKLYLRQLPAQIPLQLDALRVVLVHGSPRKINEYLYADRPDATLERLLDMAEAEVLVCGHTHIPYHRILPSGRHVVNAGSVGKPKDGNPQACYVVLETLNNNLSVTFRRVPYDVERAAQAIEANDMPHEYAEMLRTGTG